MLVSRPAGMVGRRVPFGGWIALLLLVIPTRLAVAPRYLYHFDAANFALAL